MKITQVLDSTRTRNVFDSTSMQWVTKVDSFSHPVTTQQQINSNSDQSFYFIKLPIWTAYEKAVKKLTYYAGLGASLNILVSTRGSIRDYQSAYGQMTLDRGITKLLGVDLMTRIGTRFPIGRSTEMSMGLRGGWSPTNVFTKNYPLSQFHFWYGIEIGVRKLLY
jgi:hypothetical protein